MKLSEHFSETEWGCRCGCGQSIVEKELVKTMEFIRNFINKPVIVHCVNRCPEHNKSVGGVSNSQHVTGSACDFHVRGLSMDRLHGMMLRLFDDNEIRNLGMYDWGCHVDIRPDKHIWDNR